MTITLTREEAQQVLDALECMNEGAFNAEIKLLRARLSAPEPNYRDVVIKGDLWRIEFLPDHAVSVVLVRANYEAQPDSNCNGMPAYEGSLSAGQRLSAPEPEPVAWMDEEGFTWAGNEFPHEHKSKCKPLYTAPPQREWQGLTDEEIMDLCAAQWASHPIDVARIIEAKLKEKIA
jgi:hypothetical protein